MTDSINQLKLIRKHLRIDNDLLELARAHHEYIISSIQIVGLYKDPKGDSIFERSFAAASYSREEGISNSSIEVPGLRRRIKELEDEVKVCFFL